MLSLWGVPAYLPGTRAAYGKTFNEIHRVLRNGGMAVLYPIPLVTGMQPAFEEVLDECFPTGEYDLLAKGVPSKLIIEKGILPEDRVVIDYIKNSINRQTEMFLI